MEIQDFLYGSSAHDERSCCTSIVYSHMAGVQIVRECRQNCKNRVGECRGCPFFAKLGALKDQTLYMASRLNRIKNGETAVLKHKTE